ncbi:MAG TPA: helix-turn-helix transcriptional regulator [Pseudogracilibacillus sp.]|nr:helix-turn-helix transcriptional regulator [Pseudogracilibacillus sp.]
MNVLGKRLKQARSDAGLKQIDAAEKLGISNGTLSGYERNYRDPDTDILNRMAELYEVSVDWLLGINNTKDNQISDEDYIDEELQDFIDNVKVWYKEEPETKEERLRMMKKMFEVFKEDE